jgi:hypothetical protein
MRLGPWVLIAILYFCFLHTVPLLGQPHAAPCTNPVSSDCPPNVPPECNVVANNDWTYSFQQQNLAKEILPSISTHYRRHYSSYPTYTFPITFLWDSLGISGLMDDPSPKLDCCNNIVFTRIARSPPAATFDWSGPAETVSSKPNPILQGWKLTIQVPSHLTGTTVVAAGFTEFRFSGTQLPHITITYNGQTQNYQDISCTKGSVTSVVAKPREPSGTKTNPDLLIHP